MGKLSSPLPNNVLSLDIAPGYYRDVPTLYLQVTRSGSRSWIYRFRIHGKYREMGLGSCVEVSLALARERVKQCRLQVRAGIDPIETKRAAKKKEAHERANARTFEEAAREYHAQTANSWKSQKHTDQWLRTMEIDVFPKLGSMQVGAVAKNDVLNTIDPIWLSKPQTAARLKQRVRAVLDWSTARDYRIEENPGMWAQIDKALGKQRADVKHFAACRYPDVCAILNAIRQSDASQSVQRCFEFIVLTCCRSGEGRGVEWVEIDFAARRWTIPKTRTKSGREHRVPLSRRAIEILELQKTATGGKGLIFPGAKGGPLSNMTLTALLRRRGFEFTLHGFRSTFRSWAAECTNAPNAVCEQALAHSVGNATEQAYQRSDLFEKRVDLMNNWADHCSTVAHNSQLAISTVGEPDVTKVQRNENVKSRLV